MKNHFMLGQAALRLYLCITTCVFILPSCVSVKVPFGPVPKADKTIVAKPNTPFVMLATNTADQAWISEKTGNTISYLSECKQTAEHIDDVSLEAARVIENSKIIKSSKSKIDSKDSADVIVIGKVDSHKVKMAISAFKSGDCIFSLTYGGLEEKFDSEYLDFVSFKNGFRAP